MFHTKSDLKQPSSCLQNPYQVLLGLKMKTKVKQRALDTSTTESFGTIVDDFQPLLQSSHLRVLRKHWLRLLCSQNILIIQPLLGLVFDQKCLRIKSLCNIQKLLRHSFQIANADTFGHAIKGGHGIKMVKGFQYSVRLSSDLLGFKCFNIFQFLRV